MSNDIHNYIYPLLKMNGFSFKRDSGKHEIWWDGKVSFTIPRGTNSSPRTRFFLRSELRKKCIASNREFVE